MDMPMQGAEGPPEASEAAPSMDPQQAMMVLKKFNITPESIPMIMAACEAMEAAHGGMQPGQPPAPQGQPPARQSLMQALSGRYSEGQ